MQLLKLRYFQLKRDLGYWTLIIVAGAFYFSKEVTAVSLTYCAGFLTVVTILLYTYHTNRSDRAFIKSHLHLPHLQVCFNYNLLVLAVSIPVLTSPYWYLFFVFHGIISALSFTHVRYRPVSYNVVSKRIPPQQFEWISGIRKNFPMLLGLLIMALILSPVKLFGLVPLFILNMIVGGFFTTFEPLIMLNPHALTPRQFLKTKVAFSLSAVALINAPLLAINSIFNNDALWFNVTFLFSFLLITACSVYIKYAGYEPNASLRFHVDFLFLYASVFLPYLLPLSVVIYFSNKRKAITNLSQFE